MKNLPDFLSSAFFAHLRCYNKNCQIDIVFS